MRCSALCHREDGSRAEHGGRLPISHQNADDRRREEIRAGENESRDSFAMGRYGFQHRFYGCRQPGLLGFRLYRADKSAHFPDRRLFWRR